MTKIGAGEAERPHSPAERNKNYVRIRDPPSPDSELSDEITLPGASELGQTTHRYLDGCSMAI